MQKRRDGRWLRKKGGEERKRKRDKGTKKRIGREIELGRHRSQLVKNVTNVMRSQR